MDRDDEKATNRQLSEGASRLEADAGQDDDKAELSHAKALVILDACNRKDICDLKDLAVTEGGFLSDSIRQQAWPVLLGCDDANSANEYDDDNEKTSNTNQGATKDSWRHLPRHRDEDQVGLDVNRSFVYYPSETEAELDGKKAELSDLIIETLRRYPYLCYFQGYHDICQVFLLVLPPSLRAIAVARLSALRIRDFMLPNLAPAVAQLRLIPGILNAVEPALCRHLSQTEPFFALSGTLTMYAHEIQKYDDIARLFDVLLAREQVFSVYMFAQIVLNRKEELYETPANEPEMLHSILSKLPHPLRLEELISQTAILFDKHPPESLRSWRHISSSSVLKTTIQGCAGQTMDDGERLFAKQLRELQWSDTREKLMKTLWVYRRPARGVALAVLVGLTAVYLRRSPGSWAYFTAFWPRWT